MARIDPEDFEAWRSNAVTERVFGYVAERIAMAEQMWTGLLASNDQMEPQRLAGLRIELAAKIELMRDLIELKLEDIDDEERGNDGAPRRRQRPGARQGRKD